WHHPRQCRRRDCRRRDVSRRHYRSPRHRRSRTPGARLPRPARRDGQGIIALESAGHRLMPGQLFATKSLRQLLAEEAGEGRLRRILGPVQLTSLGVGAIIGTGIFILTGVAAHDRTGPALMLSFVLAGMACVFAALCYAEFASMVPVAGSAYT